MAADTVSYLHRYFFWLPLRMRVEHVFVDLLHRHAVRWLASKRVGDQLLLPRKLDMTTPDYEGLCCW